MIDLWISGHVIGPDEMEIVGRINGQSGAFGPARGPGQPFARRPGRPSIRALFVIDLVVSRRLVPPYDMEIIGGVNGKGRIIGTSGIPGESFV
jgi:hypothetical protein